MIFRGPNIQAHCNEAVLCLNFGTPENNEFAIWNMENLLFLGVPLLRHFRVSGHTNHVVLKIIWSFINALNWWWDGAESTFSAWGPTNLYNSRERAYCACSRCGYGCLGIFLVSIFSSLYLGDGPI